jgi:hypothetical protein
MDLAAASVAGGATKKVAKLKKLTKDLMSDERWAESVKCTARREAVRARATAARLKNELLAKKAAHQAVMLMKKEALNVSFSQGVASVRLSVLVG